MKIWGHTFKTVENIKSVPKNTRDNKILASGGDDPTQMIQAVCRTENRSQCQEQKINPSWRPTSALEMKTLGMTIAWCSHLVILADPEISQNFSWYNWRQCGMKVSSGCKCVKQTSKNVSFIEYMRWCCYTEDNPIVVSGEQWVWSSTSKHLAPASQCVAVWVSPIRQVSTTKLRLILKHPLGKPPKKNATNLGLNLKL